MFLSKEKVNDFDYMFENVKIVPDSYCVKDEGYRIKERFEVQIYIPQDNKWGKPLWFHIWKDKRESRFSLNYDDGFTTLYDPNGECLKILHFLLEYVKNHPKTRILIGSMGWTIGTTPALQRKIEVYVLRKSMDEMKFDRNCEKCKKNKVFLENELCYVSQIEERKEMSTFHIYPKFHKNYFELSSQELNFVHLMIRNIHRKINKEKVIKDVKMEWMDSLNEHSYYKILFNY